MNAQERAKAWRLLEQMVGKIVDPVLRRSILGELATRAKLEWGYCPSVKEIPEEEVQLEDWQRDFLDEVKIASAYGIVPKNEEIEKENRLWMMRYVRDGGTLAGIPDEIRCEYVDGLYYECLFKYGDEIAVQVENLALQGAEKPV